MRSIEWTVSRARVGSLLFLAFCPIGLPVRAQTAQHGKDNVAKTTPQPSSASTAAVPLLPEFVLTVKTLRDAGGVERGLNTRLTMALTHFLSEQNTPAIRIGTNGAAPANTRYTLEGEVSCVTGRSEDSVRYLIVIRLYREDTQRALIGQWAGSADSLRCLTVNLRHDPRFHLRGLIGELGVRIIAALTAEQTDSAQRLHLLLPQMTAHSPICEIVSADERENVLRQIPIDGAFRLRLRTTAPVCACLVLFSASGAVSLALLSADGNWLLSEVGKKQVISLPIKTPSSTIELWAVCRLPNQTDTEAAVREGRQALSPTDRDGLQRGSSSTIAEISRTSGIIDESPVLVLNGVRKKSSTPDPPSDSLLDEVLRDPSRWSVVRFRVAGHK